MEEQRFMMLIGLVASGKSTFAKELMGDRDDIIYLSSDELREELLGDIKNQDDNSLIFREMEVRTKNALKEGKHVIYDATNINRKRRKALLQKLPKDIQKIAVYIGTDYKEALKRNENRERKVPEHTISSMYKTLHTPIYSEGWNKIVILSNEEDELPKQFVDAIRVGVLLGRETKTYELMQFLASYFDEFFQIYDLAHDSKYHNFTVSRHTYYVYKYTLENYQAKDDLDKELMLWTALLHDTGKAFCKSFENRKREETRYANFIGHEFVSSQLAINFLKRLGFNDEFVHNVATLIQFHMYLLNDTANKEKLKQYVGEDFYKKLEFLREADTQAH